VLAGLEDTTNLIEMFTPAPTAEHAGLHTTLCGLRIAVFDDVFRFESLITEEAAA